MLEPASPSPWFAAGMLAYREMLRFFRQRNRVIGAVGQPILFWLLFGAGLQQSFRPLARQDGTLSFLAYYYPGTLILILLFTAICATISVIEDRREGFLQAVLVAPLPRWAMVLGKVLGGALIATLQSLLFLGLAFTLQIPFDPLNLTALVGFLFVSAVALTALGFVFAWRMESTQGFHAIMNLVLMPMWLLSGAFFPVPSTHAGAAWSQVVLRSVMLINPVSYSVAGARRLLFPSSDLEGLWAPSLWVCWPLTLVSAALLVTVACLMARKNTTGDLI